MSEIYSKDSFDRFGDDLTEVLLSYLSIKNCFDLRYVSKQWKSLIFNKQNFLRLDNNIDWTQTSNLRQLEITLKSCPNITSIDVNNYLELNIDLIFELIIKYCDNLCEINYTFDELSEDMCNKFFEKFGSNLKKIDLKTNLPLHPIQANRPMIKFLKLCPNISHIYNCPEFKYYLNNIFNGKEILFKNLKSFSFKFFDNNSNYDSEDIQRIETLFESNKNSLEEIRITINADNKNDNYLKALNSLPKLRKLKSLKITNYMQSRDENNLIINALNKLPNNCKQLKKFDLYIPSFIGENNLNSFFQTLKTFSQLKYLSLDIQWTESDLSVHLNSFPNLKYFTLRTNKINDSFFNSIDKYLPNVQFIHLHIFRINISKQMFDSLSKLRKLRKLKLFLDINPRMSQELCTPFSQSVVKQFVKNSPKINEIVVDDELQNMTLYDKPITQLRQNEDICWKSYLRLFSPKVVYE